jgi:flagellar hook-associated protein 1 FlgK
MNDQHALGLDLDGNAGGPLFSTTDFTSATSKVFTASHVLPATSGNSSNYTLTLSLQDSTKLAASDYTVNFTSATDGSIQRSDDNTQIGFSYTAATGQFVFQTATDPAGGPYTGTSFDGLSFSTVPTTTVAAGDSFAIKPFITAAGNVSAEFSTPRSLAVASPVAVKANSANTGSLTVASLTAKTSASPIDNYRIDFTGSNTYDIVNVTTSTTVASAQPYLSGQPISFTPASPAPGWSLTLTGMAKVGDTFTIEAQPAAYRNTNSGNASAMMALRDAATFDGASLTDGYAGLIAQIGVRSQSASYTAGVSSAIAATLEKDRTAVSGVNLDEEAAKLLQYQQAYQASAKVIQIAQGIFDTLIQTMSR